MQNNYNNIYCDGSFKPVVLTFSAMNEEELNQKILLFVYNQMRMRSNKEPVKSFPTKHWYIRLSDMIFGK